MIIKHFCQFMILCSVKSLKYMLRKLCFTLVMIIPVNSIKILDYLNHKINNAQWIIFVIN